MTRGGVRKLGDRAVLCVLDSRGLRGEALKTPLTLYEALQTQLILYEAFNPSLTLYEAVPSPLEARRLAKA